MSSEQLPPPLANFSFPPDKSDLQFNYIDSFVTSWVTPESSQDPCFLSLYYWNSSSPAGPWASKFNQTVSLNSTEIVPLNMISSDGLGQLNLNYVDPVGSHKKITGEFFHINHDLTQPKAMTWNQNALSSSITSTLSTSATSSATSSPTPAASTTITPPSLTTPYSQVADTPALQSTSTATSSPAKTSSSSHSAEIASITLGTVLGIVFATALLIFWIRRKRATRTSKQADRMPSAAPVPVQYRTHAIHEADAQVALTELRSGDNRWELDTNK